MRFIIALTSLILIYDHLQAQSWNYVGSACIEPSVDAISSAGSEDLAFLDDGTPVLSHFRQTGASTIGKAYQYIDDAWEQVGTDLPNEGTISAIDLEVFGSNIYVSVLFNATQIRVYQFTGTDWEQQGAEISGNLAYDFIINRDGSLFLFNTLDQTVRKYNGSEWEAVLNLTESSSPFWGGDQTVVCDADNVFYYLQPFLNLSSFVFENAVHAWDGSDITPVGELLFTGFGTPGKLAFNQAGILHGQYQSDGTNKICRLEGETWVQLLDTTDLTNGLFGFNYVFSATDELILSVFTQMYFADGYEPLPALNNDGVAININNMVLSPNGTLYISMGEICTGGGSNFSVLWLEDVVDIDEENSISLDLYPNPTAGSVQLQGVAAGDEMLIYNAQGRLIHTDRISTSGTYSGNFDLQPGSYFVVLRTPHGLETLPFIVQ